MQNENDEAEKLQPETEAAQPAAEPAENKPRQRKSPRMQVRPQRQRTAKPKEEFSDVRMPKRRRSRRQLSTLEKLVIVVPAAAAIIAALIALWVLKNPSGVQLDTRGCQYYAEMETFFDPGTKLLRDKEGGTVVKRGSNVSKTTLPIYLEGEDTVLTTADMLYYQPRGAKYARVEPLSRIQLRNSSLLYTAGRREKEIPAGFLYDGNDFYIFLEPVQLSLPRYDMSLPAFSYIEATYGGDIIIFNYETKKCTIVPCEGTGTVTAGSGDYVLSLLGDSLTTREGKRILLASKPDLFDSM